MVITDKYTDSIKVHSHCVVYDSACIFLIPITCFKNIQWIYDRIK